MKSTDLLSKEYKVAYTAGYAEGLDLLHDIICSAGRQLQSALQEVKGADTPDGAVEMASHVGRLQIAQYFKERADDMSESARKVDLGLVKNKDDFHELVNKEMNKISVLREAAEQEKAMQAHVATEGKPAITGVK